MISPISGIPSPAGLEQAAKGTQGASGAEDFSKLLHKTIDDVEGANANANNAVQGFLSGDNQELHSTILATERADLEFNMFMQVRNKVVSAYQEIMKMQV